MAASGWIATKTINIIIIIISGVAGFQRSWPASYKLYS